MAAGVLTVSKKTEKPAATELTSRQNKQAINLRLSVDGQRMIDEIIAHYGGMGNRTVVIEKAIREMHRKIFAQK